MSPRPSSGRPERALLAAIHCWAVYGVTRLPAVNDAAARDAAELDGPRSEGSHQAMVASHTPSPAAREAR
jgi:hypothetical protein